MMRLSRRVTLQHLQIGRLPRKVTVYDLWHKWYETSFTLRGAPGVIIQPRQIWRLPRKMILMIDPRYIWNVICIARGNRTHPPTSPNIALPQKITFDEENVLKADSGRFENDPRMIRPWSMPWSSRTRPFAEVTFRAFGDVPFGKLEHFALRLFIYPNFTKCCPCHERGHSNITKCCPCHEKPHSNIKNWQSSITKCCACHKKWQSNLAKCCACFFTEVFLDWTVTGLNYSLTELCLDWTSTRLNCYFTKALLDWTSTWQNCYLTELVRDLTVTWIKLDGTSTWLN